MSVTVPISDPVESLPVSSRGPAPTSFPVKLIAIACAIAMLYYGRAFFVTLISAIIITFILQPFVLWFMRMRLPRALASFVVCTIFVLLVYLVGVGLVTQASGLIDDLPGYSQKIGELIEGGAERVREVEKGIAQFMPKRLQEPALPPELAKKTKKAKAPLPLTDPNAPPPVVEVRVQPEQSPLLTFVYSRLETIYSVTLMASFVPFLVYFMLSWSDHMQRAFLSLFDGPDRVVASRSMESVAVMARAYMAGNFVLGVILAVLSTIFFIFISIPYPLLVGPLSGFLSLVPYIGLPLALLPPFLSALPFFTKLGAYLIIASVVGTLHLFALNLLYPKIVGARVHLNPLAVTVALMFWGLIWGGIGLVLAVPIVAGIKAVCDNVAAWKPYGKLLGD
ncbi:AI-2E family transporter [Bryobacter aggregatus]|uniref:AI-2E family transporter n=1 Tax=Bryobacter aggregatus TaxID=360054 RepID=UPI0004E14E29|nr:AI-2E family transporter [Bryobacter aggregatus]